jgi:hypothetical protein
MDTREKHLEVLEQVLLKLQKNNLKINLDKCLFGFKQVFYLGFTLTLHGIIPGEAKLQVIKYLKAPNYMKTI